MLRNYGSLLTAETNQKGVLDIDPVKGCQQGIAAHGEKGCYGNCYAIKVARFRGIDFSKSIVRHIRTTGQLKNIRKEIFKNKLPFVRMGTFGDPSFAWEHTLKISNFIKECGKRIVIITKHWNQMTEEQAKKAGEIGVVLNTSISALDTPGEIAYRLGEYERYKKYGISALRIVSCQFNKFNEHGLAYSKIQNDLFRNENILDTPFRVYMGHPLVRGHVIIIEKKRDVGTFMLMSVQNKDVYLGHCLKCPDLCGLIYGK